MAESVWTPEPVRGVGDAEIARVAAIQHGFVTRAQLGAAGLGRHAIRHRLKTGRLTPRHRGVYLVGRPSVEPLGEETAAVLSFAGHAVLSGRSAAWLWRMLDIRPPEVTVTAVGRYRHSAEGLRVHRASRLDPSEVRLCQGLPVASPARAVFDLAAGAGDGELERAVAEGLVQRLLTPGELEALVARYAGRAGVARLRAVLDAEHDPALTRRELERRMLKLIRQAGLPAAIVNGYAFGFQLDFHWPAQRLVVETDGYQFHGHRAKFERDRRRDQVLVANGYRVMRITWRQLSEEPLAVTARLATALAAGN